jgi:hypothetical protein
MTTGGDRSIDGVRVDALPKCFLHIPKSAGESIYLALLAGLPPGSLAPRRLDSSVFCDFNDFELLRPEARALIAANLCEVRSLGQYRVVSGHFSLPTLLQITVASSIATVLREPRSRLLSLFMYWRIPGISDFLAPYSASEHAKLPLSEFLSVPVLAPAIDNQICRMLLYGDQRLPALSFAVQSDVKSIASDAIDRLDTLGLVSVLEFGNSVWRGLAHMFEVELEPLKMNVTEDRGTTPIGPGEELLTVEALDLLEQRNAADLLVYDHVLAHAGANVCERQRIKQGAFAHQLVKLGNLLGHSAGRAAEQAEMIEALSSQAVAREQAHAAELERAHDRLRACERTMHELERKGSYRSED